MTVGSLEIVEDERSWRLQQKPFKKKKEEKKKTDKKLTEHQWVKGQLGVLKGWRSRRNVWRNEEWKFSKLDENFQFKDIKISKKPKFEKHEKS